MEQSPGAKPIDIDEAAQRIAAVHDAWARLRRAKAVVRGHGVRPDTARELAQACEALTQAEALLAQLIG